MDFRALKLPLKKVYNSCWNSYEIMNKPVILVIFMNNPNCTPRYIPITQQKMTINLPIKPTPAPRNCPSDSLLATGRAGRGSSSSCTMPCSCPAAFAVAWRTAFLKGAVGRWFQWDRAGIRSWKNSGI